MSDVQSPGSQHPKIGHFRVIGELGQGGMGSVYLGLDETLQRQVALKVIRPEQRLDPLRKARFLREARILSKLDHPNICQFHDFIEGESQDCLVLEMVEGKNLRQAMNDGLDEGRKFEIAAQLLDVLVAVHGQGVIHRDLKPENIMLTDAGIKVLDFGLARPVDDPEALSGQFPAVQPEMATPPESGTYSEDDDSSDTSSMTVLGTVLGTIGFMSPEVARGEPATAASDLYSAGLILQELFTGRAPIPENLLPAERHRRAMWAETEPVEGLPADLTTLIKRLSGLVPESRPSAIDAAEMLQAISDRPRVQRRRRLVAAIWAVLFLFGVGMTIQFFRAERETLRAEEEAATAREISDFLMGLFEHASPRAGQGDEISVRELLQRGAETIDSELEQQPAVRSRMLHTLGTVYYQLGQYDDAAPLLDEALEMQRKLSPDGGRELIDVLRSVGLLRRAEGRYDEAERILDEALDLAEIDPGPTSALTARLLISRAGIDQDRSRLDEAEPRLARAVAILESHPDGVGEGLTDAIFDLASLNRKLRRLDHAERYMRRCLELDTAEFGEVSGQVAGDFGELCAIVSLQGRHNEAEVLARKSLDIRTQIFGARHPYIGHSATSLGVALTALGRFDEATAAFMQALEIYSEIYGTEHPYIGDVQHSLGSIAAKQGNLDEAVRFYQESLDITESIRGPDHRLVAETVNGLAEVRSDQGRYAEAEALFLRALAVREANFDENDPRIAETLESYADCLLRAGRADEAGALEERARSIRSASATVNGDQ